MAEAVAAVGVVASILQLIQFGSQLVARLDDFVVNSKDVPETFLNISTQLPLALSTLQRLRARVDNNELLESESKALKALVDRSLALTKDVNGVLDKLIPPKTASSLEKRLLAFRSLRFDKTVQNASAQLLQNANLLAFFQTTQIQESTTNIAKKLEINKIASASPAEHLQHGLNLNGAPRLADGNFVGRKTELRQLTRMLDPESTRQNIVAVVGMGGMGKTQLCVEYAVSNQDEYSSIFWFNALDESSLRADVLTTAQIVLSGETSMLATRADEDALIQKVRRWFSLPENRKWLIIFDNVDNPKIPGVNDPAAIDIKNYFPYRSQGSILITTRSRKITFAKQLNLHKFDKIEQGLELLTSRCGQSLNNDLDAIELVDRLDGLPLALASAASFLERTSCTTREYLDEYNRNWLDKDSESLLEYGDRTLFTTWDMSYDKIKSQIPEAAEMLRILAFFGSENIEYSLLGAHFPKLWPGLGDCMRNEAAFHRLMGKLRDYSMVETSGRSYRLHPYLHDWTLLSLNQNISHDDMQRVLFCILFASQSGSSFWSTNYDDSMARLGSHALRLVHPQLFEAMMNMELDESHANVLYGFGELLYRGGRSREAIQLLTRSMEWSLVIMGEDGTDVLHTCNVLGLAHRSLQNHTKATALFRKASYGLARTLGRHDKATLDPVHNLALLYQQLGMMSKAEEMYIWSLEGCEESYGLNDPNTFWAVSALASFYLAKGNLDQAKKEFHRALDGFDAAIDHDHYFARSAATSLGAIYRLQEDYETAAAMYERVYESNLRLLGPEHLSTQEAKSDLESLKVLSQLNVDAAHSPTAAKSSQDLFPNHSSPKTSAASATEIPIRSMSGFESIETLVEMSETDFNSKSETDGVVAKNQQLTNSGRSSPQDLMARIMTLIDAQKDDDDNQPLCDECGTALTTSPETFMCCICAKHEVCGECHTKWQTSSRPKASEESRTIISATVEHVFVRCEDTP